MKTDPSKKSPPKPLSEIERIRRKELEFLAKEKCRRELEAISRYAQFRLRGKKFITEFNDTEEGLILIIKIPPENWKID